MIVLWDNWIVVRFYIIDIYLIWEFDCWQYRITHLHTQYTHIHTHTRAHTHIHAYTVQTHTDAYTHTRV